MPRFLTVDAIIVKDGRVLLIKRKNPPFKDRWALPGGYVDRGETAEEAVIREAKEEAGLTVKPVEMTGIYDDPKRDLRGNVATAWLCRITGGDAKAGSDAQEAEFFDLKRLPQRLAFDHGDMIRDAAARIKPVRVLAGGAFNLVHPGHVHFLMKAKELGDELVVVVASDRTVLRNGKRLLFPAETRAKAVKALSFVDRVVLGDERDWTKVVKKERPDVIALGYDQDGDAVEEKLKGTGLKHRLARIGELKGYSTKMITGS